MPTLAQLEKLLTTEPDDPFVLYAIALEHTKAHDHAQALTYFDRCLKADPDYTYAYYHKARSLEALGRDRDAIATLQAVMPIAQRVGDEQCHAETAAYLAALGA